MRNYAKRINIIGDISIKEIKAGLDIIYSYYDNLNKLTWELLDTMKIKEVIHKDLDNTQIIPLPL